MIKIVLEIEEKDKNCQVRWTNENFDKGTKNEQMSTIQIINHMKKLFEEVHADKEEVKEKKTNKKKTTKKKEN